MNLSELENKNNLSIFAAVLASCILLVSLISIPYTYGAGTTLHSLGYVFLEAWNQEDMGHGFLVVPAACLIIYRKKHSLLKMHPQADVGGLFLLMFGLFLFWAGNQADVTFIGLSSIIIVLAGTVWWLLGWKFLKELAFPLAFLLFAIPFPGVDTLIALPLRYLMSNISVVILNLVGIPSVLNGTGILSAPDPALGQLAGQKFGVDVANPCSGIRSLFALMMVGALYAHFTLQGAWKKWILFFCTIPLAVLGNLARIVMLTLGTVLFGSEFALGKNSLENPSWFHLAAGYLVFIIALLGMMGVGALLDRQRSSGSKKQKQGDWHELADQETSKFRDCSQQDLY